MLILTRKIGESIIIGDDIEVSILRVSNSNEVRVGIDAPKDISVHRDEIYARIQRNEPYQKAVRG